ncbi:MAG TPA: hypothetical protein VJU77_11115 [Chthoniobacterales bacterium]|nr:hypothetical protein [Chthoniobacterales bacterium]
MLVRSAATACAIIVAVAQVIAGKPAEPASVVYTVSSKAPVLDRTAAKLFSDEYRVVTIKPGGEFVPARVKGNDVYFGYYDPRPMRETKTPAKAAVGFIITAEGYVKDLRVLESTDPRVADHVINQIQMRRFVPAKYRGVAVASLEYRGAHFGPVNDKDSSMFKDGMGIMGYRDR